MQKGKGGQNGYFTKGKNDVFEDLADTLTKGANYKTVDTKSETKEIIGWAREANISISSTLNTSEVLLGLLFSRNVIVHGKLSGEVSRCIEGGINFLLENQCKTGGWTTSESDASWADGNLVSTALAVWAINEYELLFDRDAEIISSCMQKAFGYVKASQPSYENEYKFRIKSPHTHIMATAYALLALVSLKIYSINVKNGDSLFEGIDQYIEKAVHLFYDNTISHRASFFEQTMCFISLKQIYKYEIALNNRKIVDMLYNNIENTLIHLSNDEIYTPYKDVRDVRENGTESEFCYFTQCWLLIALDYCKSTLTPYKVNLLKSISKTLVITKNDTISVNYQGREWIWAIAQVLMGLSIHSTTQRLDDFMGLTDDLDHNSVFLVYGRNHELKESVENILSALSLNVITYHNSKANANGTYHAVKDGMSKSSISIILLTGDDEGRCRKEYLIPADRGLLYEKKLTKQPRLNVVFEAGYSFAHRADNNVILITINNVRLFSDIDGINRIIIQTDRMGRIPPSSVVKFKAELIDNLKNCGCTLPQNPETILRGITLPDHIK